jgi:hypothetical protein
MLRAIVFIACILASPAWAFLPGQPVGMLNPQVLPGNASAGLPATDDQLGAGGYPVAGGICSEWGHLVPCNNHYAIVRASPKYANASDGFYSSVAAGVFALGSVNGGLIEQSATNLALWSRDLTQSGTWIAVTMTATKNAVGIDGAANSATTLTSTSTAGTILQSLTASSTAYTYTVFVKGVTVTGAIQAADYPALTPAFTTLSSSNCFNAAGVGTAPASSQTGFLRCTITATSLNPVIGFKFANSGDSIVVDFNQLEANSFGTSPILTTSSTSTRAADNVTMLGLALTTLKGTIGSARVSITLEGDTGTFSDAIIAASSNSVQSTTGGGSGGASGVFFEGNTTIFLYSRRFNVNSRDSTFYAWQVSNYAGSLSGGTVATSSSAQAVFGGSSYNLGSLSGSSQFSNGNYDRVTLFPVRLSNAILQSQP